ncbi:molybdopterin-dependent oxidoreductase [Methylomarinum sp. Ch1-1]|uniref:Molybdopterin-dependent oxidoreductase n=1 Tax=Methylomarinum roseum TaxID=3067653 RepID=A0AAU7NX08_9GAMM
MSEHIIKTTCPYCGVGCGVEAVIEDAKAHKIKIQGDKQHPANYGRLCSKGSALADTVSREGRLLYPEIKGRRCGWEQALTHVASGFNDIIAKHGRNAVAFYVSGQLLTEDYYVANKLMKGFIGSANIDTNSRLCMSSAVVGYKRAFGSDTVPGNYQDLELADLLVLVGSNLAWCHPVAFQRIRKAKENNPKLKIVVIDPRDTDSCDLADLHLPLRPGSDVSLFNGLLCYLAENNKLDMDFIEQHTDGFSDTLLSAQSEAGNVRHVAEHCDLPEPDLRQFYSWFAQCDKTVSLYSQGVNQSSAGSDKCNAIINCHLATGRIGKPGAAPFSLTGQPNAMGGREVGGLANTLAAHMELDNPEHVRRLRRFWNSEQVADQPGLKAVELFDAVASGNVKAIWIMATNPVVSLPNADFVKQALQRCDLVVVSDCIASTDTTAWADVKLPAAGWSEKDGTVTNCERRISRQRALFPSSGEARPDWRIICEVAKHMGFDEGFNFNSAAEIFQEHAALSAFENDESHGIRDFNLAGLCGLSERDYARLQPVQWPVTDRSGHGVARLFSDGRFFTPNARANFIPVNWRAPVNAPTAAYPFILNTGRIRDQWHTMTRTGLSARLSSHKPEPFVEIHPKDADRADVVDGGLALLESRWGSMLGRVHVTSKQKMGCLFAPMHWTEQLSRCGRVGATVNPVVDPYSGQPESKHTPVRVSPYIVRHYLFVISRQALTLPRFDYCVKVRGERYWLYHLATKTAHDDIAAWARTLLPANTPGRDPEWIEYRDTSAGVYRAAQLGDEQLQSCVFVSSHWQLPDSGWLQSLFSQGRLSQAERLSLLSAKPPKGQADVGRTVCACFNIGEQTLIDTIEKKKLTDVDAIGRCLGAGTGCGSCLPELKALLG